MAIHPIPAAVGVLVHACLVSAPSTRLTFSTMSGRRARLPAMPCNTIQYTPRGSHIQTGRAVQGRTGSSWNVRTVAAGEDIDQWQVKGGRPPLLVCRRYDMHMKGWMVCPPPPPMVIRVNGASFGAGIRVLASMATSQPSGRATKYVPSERAAQRSQ
jgi:hypothetical protein